MVLLEPFRKSSWKNRGKHISEDTARRQKEDFLIFYLNNYNLK
jgi:hypothetical protein